MSCMSCMSRVAQAFMTNNKEGMNMLVLLHNFSSFQSHLMTGLVFFFLVYVCKPGSYGVALLFLGV